MKLNIQLDDLHLEGEVDREALEIVQRDLLSVFQSAIFWRKPQPAEPKKEVSWQIALIDKGENRIDLIKEVRAFTGFGLKESKDLVEGHCGTILFETTNETKAYTARAAFERTSARVDMYEITRQEGKSPVVKVIR